MVPFEGPTANLIKSIVGNGDVGDIADDSDDLLVEPVEKVVSLNVNSSSTADEKSLTIAAGQSLEGPTYGVVLGVAIEAQIVHGNIVRRGCLAVAGHEQVLETCCLVGKLENAQ